MNENIDFSTFKWKVRLRFPNGDAFKKVVVKFAVTNGKNLSFVFNIKNRQQRLWVNYFPRCSFRLYASWGSWRAFFLIKSMDGEYSCNINMEGNKKMRSTWLAEKFLEVLKARPHWPANKINETVRRAFMVSIKKPLVYKVKYYAHKILHGSMQYHYNKLGRYLEVLKIASP